MMGGGGDVLFYGGGNACFARSGSRPIGGGRKEMACRKPVASFERLLINERQTENY
jgi:hypothetical protein